tara:strand:- start:26 stop:262 length:237 start_codon:yes stop_codon:yes gene_type:complete
MSLTITQKFAQSLVNIGYDKQYIYEGDNPLTEEIFLKSFSVITGTEKLEDGSEIAKTSKDPKDFGVTWTQIKTEMDKL